MTIDILLATYNGEKYLREQLDSIISQSNGDWRIIVRDDGSTDSTAQILNEYAAQLGKKKFIVLDPTERSPAESVPTWKRIIHNFSTLMEWSKSDGTAEYVMFSDQDDIWHSDKVAKTLEAMHALEAQHGKDDPLLVHTDASIMYESPPKKAAPTEVSHKKLSRTDPETHTLRKELVYCTTQGCTMMLNRKLLDIAGPVPDAALMHDSWVGLVAQSIGYSAYLPELTLDYRQHESNVSTGAHNNNMKKRVGRVFKVIDGYFSQAQALYERFGDVMHPDAKEDVKTFLQIASEPRLVRGARLLQGGFGRPTRKHNLALLGGHKLEIER